MWYTGNVGARQGAALHPVLRGRRQRGSPLWNPVCRLRAGMGAPFVGSAAPFSPPTGRRAEGICAGVGFST
ncbi:hypothetical protein D7X33_05505 [Butyricicoccus sp. 1XD8-22]|nr:hypothetical protein D7X33_05505 [Butyricicoccus sp. 1XD8-22]